MQGEREEDTRKYYIVFDDGNINMLVAQDVTLDEAKEIVNQQIEPSCYKIIPKEQAAG